MSCDGCGDHDNPNVNEGTRCGNPCNITDHNSAACESLPSQIENFTKQFFGEVFKTEENGVVSWSLPCSLDVGLPANPRGVDEGLACYFLRLFQNGITGLKGDKGNTGAAGTDGKNSYTVTLHSFTHPTLSSPFVTVVGLFNPTILDGSYVFIDTSGWYLVNGSDGAGSLFLQLVKPLSGAPGTIPAGKLVVPAGIPGDSITGPQGPAGPQGPTGAAGTSFTAHNNAVQSTGSAYVVPSAVPTLVAFPAGNVMQLLLTNPGTYLVTANVQYTPQAGVALGHSNFFTAELFNVSTSTLIPGSVQTINNMTNDWTRYLTLTALVNTSGPNQTVAIYVAAYAASVVQVEANHTYMNYVQVG